MFLTGFWIVRNRNSLNISGRMFQIAIALLLPIALIGLGLGWYNWARFGSVFEFGYRYQLTLLELPRRYGEIFSPAYILPNLYNYFLNPVASSDAFPFILPRYGIHDLGSGITIPKIYFSEPVAGLVYTLPILVLAIVPFLRLLQKRESNRVFDGSILHWLVYSLIGIALIEFSTLLAFFFATMRYLADVVPAFILLSILGFWQGYEYLGQQPLIRSIFSSLSTLFVAISIIVTTLLAISSYQERFWITNPSLMEQINQLFNH
jgi:hypothetical protein